MTLSESVREVTRGAGVFVQKKVERTRGTCERKFLVIGGNRRPKEGRNRREKESEEKSVEEVSRGLQPPGVPKQASAKRETR